jgi:hypothetical protein
MQCRGWSHVSATLSAVIAGLDPAIHLAKKMDARVKPAHDTGAQGGMA